MIFLSEISHFFENILIFFFCDEKEAFSLHEIVFFLEANRVDQVNLESWPSRHSPTDSQSSLWLYNIKYRTWCCKL